MIDPSIALEVRPPQFENPLALYGQMLSLKTLAQQQQLQQAQLTGANLSNQAAEQALTDDQQFRQLFTQSLQSGQPISQADIMKTLGPVRGAAYNKSMLDVAETRSRLQKAADDHAEAEQNWAGATAYSLQQSIDPKTGLPDPQAVADAVRQAHALGYEQEARTFSGIATQNPQAIPGVLDQMIRRSNKQRTVQAQEDSAAARRQQAQNSADRDKQLAGYQAQLSQLDAERTAEQQRHNKVMESQGATRLDQSQQRLDKNSKAPNGKTYQQNQTEYDKAAAEEQKQDRLREVMGDALTNDLYVLPNGQTVPYEKVIPKQGANEKDDDYQARYDKSKAGLRKDLQVRYLGASRAANAATARKNAAIEGNGEEPEVSNEDAAQARGGSQQQPAATPKPSAPQQPPPEVVRKMQAGKITTFANGQKWMKYADGSVKQVQ